MYLIFKPCYSQLSHINPDLILIDLNLNYDPRRYYQQLLPIQQLLWQIHYESPEAFNLPLIYA